MSKEKVEFDKNVHGNTLKTLIEEASDDLLTIEGYRDHIKELRDRAKEELGVEGKMFNNLLRIHHKRARESFESEKDEVVELYDACFE